MKIAVLSYPMLPTPPPNYGGLELVAYNGAYGFAELGHKVVLFATEGSTIPPKGFLVETGPAVNVVHADWLKAEQEHHARIQHMLGDFDIIWGNNWFGLEYLSKLRNPNLKVCHTHHGGLNMEWWGRSHPPFKLNLISISKWMQSVYRQQSFESRVCYNGINLDLYPYNQIHGKRLLFIGRIDTFKQPDLAIRVAKKIGLGLDIIGGTFVQDNTYLENIKSMCDGKQIKFYPDVTHEFKVKMLRKCKAVLFTSKMGEPFGLVPIEAFACGAPVLSTVDGATPETIKDGEVGFLCRTEEDMVLRVKDLDMIKPEKCREWAKNFSHVKMCEQYLTRFKEILNGDEW